MLALARVLVEKPRLLIADELSLGLAPIVVDEVYRTLETIRDSGTTLLIVEQHVHHALGDRRRRDRAREGRGRVLRARSSELGDLQARILARRDAGAERRSEPAYVPNSAACVTRASVSTICVRLDAHLSRQHVVVEPFEHRDDARARRSTGIEVGRSRRPRCAR